MHKKTYKQYFLNLSGKIFGAGLLMFFAYASAWAVDINRASAEELAAQLRNIGLMKAHAIVAYRKRHGMFQSADDLQKIEGIGPRTVEMNRSKITTGKTDRDVTSGEDAKNNAGTDMKNVGHAGMKPDARDKTK